MVAGDSYPSDISVILIITRFIPLIDLCLHIRLDNLKHHKYFESVCLKYEHCSLLFMLKPVMDVGCNVNGDFLEPSSSWNIFEICEHISKRLKLSNPKFLRVHCWYYSSVCWWLTCLNGYYFFVKRYPYLSFGHSLLKGLHVTTFVTGCCLCLFDDYCNSNTPSVCL